jgi:hypothetical protein
MASTAKISHVVIFSTLIPPPVARAGSFPPLVDKTRLKPVTTSPQNLFPQVKKQSGVVVGARQPGKMWPDNLSLPLPAAWPSANAAKEGEAAARRGYLFPAKSIAAASPLHLVNLSIFNNRHRISADLESAEVIPD